MSLSIHVIMIPTSSSKVTNKIVPFSKKSSPSSITLEIDDCNHCSFKLFMREFCYTVLLIFLIYIFVVCISLLGSSFKILVGKSAAQVFFYINVFYIDV